MLESLCFEDAKLIVEVVEEFRREFGELEVCGSDVLELLCWEEMQTQRVSRTTEGVEAGE